MATNTYYWCCRSSIMSILHVKGCDWACIKAGKHDNIVFLLRFVSKCWTWRRYDHDVMTHGKILVTLGGNKAKYDNVVHTKNLVLPAFILAAVARGSCSDSRNGAIQFISWYYDAFTSWVRKPKLARRNKYCSELSGAPWACLIKESLGFRAVGLLLNKKNYL